MPTFDKKKNLKDIKKSKKMNFKAFFPYWYSVNEIPTEQLSNNVTM